MFDTELDARDSFPTRCLFAESALQQSSMDYEVPTWSHTVPCEPAWKAEESELRGALLELALPRGQRSRAIGTPSQDRLVDTDTWGN